MAVITDLETIGFPFDDDSGDRDYSASAWRAVFEKIFTNGVISLEANELKINPQASPNKTIFIDTGSIIINGATRAIGSATNKTIADNSSGSTRIDRIVARLNLNAGVRNIEFDVLQGTPGAGAPALTQSATTWEMSLAQIELINGYTTITASEITDERTFSKTNGQDTFEKENDLNQYSRDVTTVDSDGNPTVIEYDRADATLAMKRTHSNPDSSGNYQTTVEEFYEEDGTTVYRTDTYTRTFLSNGLVDTQSRTVVYS